MPIVRENDTIHLNLLLEDGKEDAYPQAILRDQDGVTLGASPVDLTHAGEGLYQNDTVPMPNTEQVTATYITYLDASHTVEDCYSREKDVFTLDKNAPIIENIDSNVSALIAGGFIADITGIIESPGNIEGLIADPGSIEGIVEGDSIVIGLVEEMDLIGIIPDNQEIVGVVPC